jgi:hypothetical protein
VIKKMNIIWMKAAGGIAIKRHRRSKRDYAIIHVMISGKEDRSRTELWKAAEMRFFSLAPKGQLLALQIEQAVRGRISQVNNRAERR